MVALLGLMAFPATACIPETPPPEPEPPAPLPPPPSLVAVSTQAAGLSIPWDLAFAPDGTLLFTERANGLRVLDASTVRPVVGGAPADLVVLSEGGKMGLALDPARGRRWWNPS